jgi:hypothetical protein
MGVSTRVTMRVVVTTPLTVTPSLASESEPPHQLGTLTVKKHLREGFVDQDLLERFSVKREHDQHT